MKITLSHKEQREVIPDAVTITIKVECRGIDHATSASRVNLLQNQILERLSPLHIHRHRPDDQMLSIERCVAFPNSSLKHHSTALYPSPILYTTELTGIFILQ